MSATESSTDPAEDVLDSAVKYDWDCKKPKICRVVHISLHLVSAFILCAIAMSFIVTSIPLMMFSGNFLQRMTLRKSQAVLRHGTQKILS